MRVRLDIAGIKHGLLLSILVTVIGLVLESPALTQDRRDTEGKAIQLNNLKKHVSFLASDELAGRATGSDEIKVAARYLASRFRSWGLESYSDEDDDNTYFQSVPLRKQRYQASIALHDKSGKDSESISARFMRRMAGSATGSFRSRPMVFAGYGISDPKRNYDDYDSVDVTGKYVVVFRHEPNESDSDSTFDGTDWTRHAYFRTKYKTARKQGAKGLILINDPRGNHDRLPGSSGGHIVLAGDESTQQEEENGKGNEGQRMPFLAVSSEAGAHLLGFSEDQLLRLQKQIDRTLTPHSFQVDQTASLTVRKTEVRDLHAQNVVGILPGTDEQLKEQCVVLGAHYDGSGTRSSGPDRIRNSADDNASGTAAVLELARVFASREQRPRRSLVFALFTGEEQGLFGSTYYARNPVVSLERTVAMLNFDMVGRSDDGTVSVFGATQNTSLHRLVTYFGNQNPVRFQPKKPNRRAASDYNVFSRNDVPYLFYFTGFHDDYHSAGDEWRKIRYRPLKQITRHAYHVTDRLANIDNPTSR